MLAVFDKWLLLLPVQREVGRGSWCLLIASLWLNLASDYSYAFEYILLGNKCKQSETKLGVESDR